MTTSITTKPLGHIYRIGACLMAGILLSACSQLPPTPTPTTVADKSANPSYGPYSYRANELSKLTQWDVEGKIAVYQAKKNNSGNLTWRQRQGYFDLLITGPLGQGHLHIEGSPGLVIATTPEQKTEASSVEQLFAEHFDWQFPMQELRYWVRGIASPESDADLTYNDSGELATLRQDGWQVSFLRYSQVSGLPMPEKITLTNNEIRLKLVLKNWANLYPFPRLNMGTSN